MQECPRCQSTEIRKDGIVKRRQRFRCKTCNFRFTVQHIGKPINKRREAFILYLAGLDYRRIGKLIDTSHVTIFNWLKNINGNIKQIKGEKLKAIQTENVIKHLKQESNNKQTKGLLLIEFTDETTNIMFVMKDK